ncbi:MAG: translation initiation factor IF-3, partial [Myxococcota bacterium]|nr:translation initiation factor IF-3 [Myxococcota bacterium]
GPDGEQLGVMTPEAGIDIARENGLDLVEVAPGSRPPVCRVMDYGRYKYEQKKKKSGANKNAHAASLKEVKLRPGTDMHDLEFKLKNARKFLLDGDKVKVTVMFRGREMVHQSRGRDQLMQVVKLLGSLVKTESTPRMEGRFMSMILVGDREAIAEAKRAEEAANKSADEEAGNEEAGNEEAGNEEAAESAETVEAAVDASASDDVAEEENEKPDEEGVPAGD